MKSSSSHTSSASGLRITGVRTRLLSFPYREEAAVEWSKGTLRAQAATLVEVVSASGLSGIGECYAGVFAPSAIEGIVRHFEPFLSGRDAFAIEPLVSELRSNNRWWAACGLGANVIAAIENALFDLKGKALGVPVWQLLGGLAHAELPMYASTAGDLVLEEVVADARRVVGQGFRWVKIPIGFGRERDQAIVASVREALGPDVQIAVDAVQGYAPRPWSAKTAIQVARAIEGHDIAWFEEPASGRDPEANAQVRRATSIPVSGGESLGTVSEFILLIDGGAFDIVQPDASHVGILESKTVIRYAAARGLGVIPHSWGSGPCLMANYHLAFSTPSCFVLEFPTTPNPLVSELLVEPFRVEDGRLSAPTTPGLGVHLPDDAEDRFPFLPDSGYRTFEVTG